MLWRLFLCFFPFLSSFVHAFFYDLYSEGSIYFGKKSKKALSLNCEGCKELDKVKRKHIKIADNKHKHINDIEETWGYTKEQDYIIGKVIEKRAYGYMYNKLSASLFPQIIALIDMCNAKTKRL